MTELFDQSVIDQPSQLATVPEQPMDQPRSQLTDLRQLAMSIPVHVLQGALAEYADKRQAFRDWLLKQLVEGVHYGYVPGTEPNYDASGNLVTKYWSKQKNSYVETKIAPKSWQAKRSLYKAGAEFVVDLMGLRPAYEADLAGWQQQGSKAGLFVYKCTLISRSTSEVVGEGTGARLSGTKGGDENNAVKMAQKCAMVAAVLNSYGLSDLFTQDIEDRRPDPHDNPEPNARAPKAATRNQRKEPVKANTSGVTMPDVKQISDAWKRDNASVANDKKAFSDWVFNTTERDFDCRALSAWTKPDVTKCQSALGLAPGLSTDMEGVPF